MRVLAKLTLIITFTLLGGSMAANAANVTQRRTVAAYRVELHITALEPFFSKQEVVDKHVKKGMEIVGGAAPIAMDAASHPNRHLAVYIFRRRSRQVVTDATVAMTFCFDRRQRQRHRCSDRCSGGCHAGDRRRPGLDALRQQRNDAGRTL